MLVRLFSTTTKRIKIPKGCQRASLVKIHGVLHFLEIVKYLGVKIL